MFEDIHTELDASDGTVSVSMPRLRDEAGYQRLGRLAPKEISRLLHSEGIEHYPSELPQDIHQRVRLYKVGSDAWKLWQTMMNVKPNADRAIGQAARCVKRRNGFVLRQDYEWK